MAGSKTDFYESAILNLMRGEDLLAWTPYVALFTEPVSENSTTTELDIDGYVRQQVAFGAPVSEGEYSQVSSSSTVSFPLMTGNGEQVVAIGYFDSLTEGNLKYYDNDITPITIDGRTIVEMAAGELKIKEK